MKSKKNKNLITLKRVVKHYLKQPREEPVFRVNKYWDKALSDYATKKTFYE